VVPHEISVEFVVALESRVWDALVHGDSDADHALLARDFLGVYPTGFADRAGHADQLADGPTVASYAIAEAQLIHVSPMAVVLCYRADYRRLLGGVAQRPETMYVSSLWVERDGRWLNVFSQDTPAAIVPDD
jgi:hypothetical protein